MTCRIRYRYSQDAKGCGRLSEHQGALENLEGLESRQQGLRLRPEHLPCNCGARLCPLGLDLSDCRPARIPAKQVETNRFK